MKKKFVVMILVFTLLTGIFACACENDSDREPQRKGDIYDLRSVFEEGFIDIEDIKNISYYQNEYLGISEDTDDFSPAPKNPETLSNEQEADIKESLAYRDRRHAEPSYAFKYSVPEDYDIICYYGTYNGYAAIMVTDRKCGYTDVVWEDEFQGVVINYTSGNKIVLWKPLTSE